LPGASAQWSAANKIHQQRAVAVGATALRCGSQCHAEAIDEHNPSVRTKVAARWSSSIQGHRASGTHHQGILHLHRRLQTVVSFMLFNRL
jgi:hypothetical protein